MYNINIRFPGWYILLRTKTPFLVIYLAFTSSFLKTPSSFCKLSSLISAISTQRIDRTEKKCRVFFGLLFVLHDLSDITEGLDGENKRLAHRKGPFLVRSYQFRIHITKFHVIISIRRQFRWYDQRPKHRFYAIMRHTILFLFEQILCYFSPLLLPALC